MQNYFYLSNLECTPERVNEFRPRRGINFIEGVNDFYPIAKIRAGGQSNPNLY